MNAQQEAVKARSEEVAGALGDQIDKTIELTDANRRRPPGEEGARRRPSS